MLQECSTAEEYKELLALMEERLRVMRQVDLAATQADPQLLLVMIKIIFHSTNIQCSNLFSC